VELPLIHIVKGTPSPEELAALVTVVLAQAGQTPAPADACGARGGAFGPQHPAWKSPAAWAAARRRGDGPRRRPSLRRSPWPTTESSAARAPTAWRPALTAVQGGVNGGTAMADSCALPPAVVPMKLVKGARSRSSGGTSEGDSRS
jgi:hypothetical protein